MENVKKLEDTRIALVGIIVENLDIIHDYSDYIVGRMGIPYKNRGVAIISLVIDAPVNIISSLSGKLGMLDDVSVKVQYTKV